MFQGLSVSPQGLTSTSNDHPSVQRTGSEWLHFRLSQDEPVVASGVPSSACYPTAPGLGAGPAQRGPGLFKCQDVSPGEGESSFIKASDNEAKEGALDTGSGVSPG